VILTSLIAYFFVDLTENSPLFRLTGTVKGGFPNTGPPEFALPYNATTTAIQLSVLDSWNSILGFGPLTIGVIGILQNVAISKAFGTNQVVDATQEMLALGAANIVGSFFSAMPVSGSFSRSAVNKASGVRTPFGGLYTGKTI